MGKLLESTTSGAMVVTWDSSKRLLELRFDRETSVTHIEGAALVDLLTRSIGSDGQRFGLLCDAAKLTGLDAGYRKVTGNFFRQHRDDCLIAAFHMGPVVRIVADLFRIATGTRVKGFAAEADARAWLRENDIGA